MSLSNGNAEKANATEQNPEYKIWSTLVHSMVFTMESIANSTMVFSTCLRLAEIPEKNSSSQKELEISVDEATFPYKLYILSLILI